MRKPIGSEVKWAECSLIIGTSYRVQGFAWYSIAQKVSEWVFSLLAIWCLRLPSFESWLQQRKTTCLLSIRKFLASAKAWQLTTTNIKILHIIYVEYFWHDWSGAKSDVVHALFHGVPLAHTVDDMLLCFSDFKILYSFEAGYQVSDFTPCYFMTCYHLWNDYSVKLLGCES